TNSATAFQVQNSTAAAILDVDTSSARVGINTAAPSADLSFGDGADRTINIVTRTTNAAGRKLTVQAGNAGAGASPFDGGNLVLQGGDAAGTGSSDGGSVTLRGGLKNGSGEGGQIIFDNSTTQRADFLIMQGAQGELFHMYDTNQPGHYNGLLLLGGACCNVSNPYRITFSSNNIDPTIDVGVDDTSTDNGKNLQLLAGSSSFTNGNGGAVILTGGDKNGTGTKPGVYVQNKADTTTAFRVLNSAGTVAVVTVDTTNERLYVGPTAGDTVGALLVLGNKTNTGDPTGVNGGMYYNSNNHEFRCYRDSNWEACGINPIDRGFEVDDEFLGGQMTTGPSGIGTNNTYGQLGWHGFTIGGVDAAINFNPTTPTPSADHPGVMQINANGGANTGNSFTLGNSNGGSLILGASYDMKTTVAADTTSNQVVLRVGMFPVTSGVTTQPVSGAWFEIDPATNSHYRYCTGNGTTASCTNSTVSLPAANGWGRLEIRITATGSGTSAATFIMNGTSASVSAVTIDTTNTVSPGLQCYATSATARACYWDYFQLTGLTSTAR
ncbi:MAG TPA: hypothetical protein VHQ86_02390, partial [Candidatus Saccharimonadia bacterium]|nr:hypothetical protein [Candidatus Saccharimonadia bacterium]